MVTALAPTPNQLFRAADENGWTRKAVDIFGYWTAKLVRGQHEVVLLRIRDGRITAAEADDGSGIIVAPKRNKAAEVLSILTDPPKAAP